MTEALKTFRKREELVIDVKENWHINYWCDELNLRAEELKEIIKTVGPAVHDVRLHVTKKLLINWPKIY